MRNVPTGRSDFRRGRVAAYGSILAEFAIPPVSPVALWQVNDVYMADPRRILDEHRSRWWQRFLGRCGCGGRRPCPAVEAALDVLFMRRRWDGGYGHA
jgi:hypothetical protein